MGERDRETAWMALLDDVHSFYTSTGRGGGEKWSATRRMLEENIMSRVCHVCESEGAGAEHDGDAHMYDDGSVRDVARFISFALPHIHGSYGQNSRALSTLLVNAVVGVLAGGRTRHTQAAQEGGGVSKKAKGSGAVRHTPRLEGGNLTPEARGILSTFAADAFAERVQLDVRVLCDVVHSFPLDDTHTHTLACAAKAFVHKFTTHANPTVVKANIGVCVEVVCGLRLRGVDLSALLCTCVESEQWSAAERLVDHLLLHTQHAQHMQHAEHGDEGVPAFCSPETYKAVCRRLVEGALKAQRYKQADRYAASLGLSAEFPDARDLHKRSTLEKLVKKGQWRLAATLATDTETHMAILVELMLAHGQRAHAVQVCAEWGLQPTSLPMKLLQESGDTGPMDDEGTAQQDATYLRLHWTPEKLLVVDDLASLARASELLRAVMRATQPGPRQGNVDAQEETTDLNHDLLPASVCVIGLDVEWKPDSKVRKVPRAEVSASTTTNADDEHIVCGSSSTSNTSSSSTAICSATPGASEGGTADAPAQTQQRLLSQGRDRKRRKGAQFNRAALLQLGTDAFAFLFDLYVLLGDGGASEAVRPLDDLLTFVFTDATSIKAGFCFSQDMSVLRR